MAKNLSAAQLAARIAQLYREGTSENDAQKTLLGFCKAEGMNDEETEERIAEAKTIWIAMKPVIEAATPSQGKTEQDSATSSPQNPMPQTKAQANPNEQPPPWLGTLLAAIQTPSKSPRRRRQPDPDMFDGTRSKFPVFEQQLTAKVENDAEDFSTDKEACDYAFGRLKGTAASLVLPYMSHMKDTGSYDYQKLIIFFRQMFGDPHQEERARDKLMSMKQGKKNIRNYVLDFQEQLLLSRSGLNEEMKMTIFRNGLNHKLQDKLIGIDCKDQDELQNHTIKISDQLYRMELYSKGNSRGFSGGKLRLSYSQQEREEEKEDDDAMEGVEYTGKSYLSKKEYGKLLQEGRCFNCKEKGHMANTCPESSDPDEKPRYQKKKPVRTAKVGSSRKEKPLKLSKGLQKERAMKVSRASRRSYVEDASEKESLRKEPVFTSEEEESDSENE